MEFINCSMADQYLQVAIFAIIAVLIPASMLLFSMLVRPKNKSNKVQVLSYESAEETIGQRVEIMHEYLHYFIAFLSFEIIGVIVIIWSTFARSAQSLNGVYIIFLLLLGVLFEFLLLRLSRGNGE